MDGYIIVSCVGLAWFIGTIIAINKCKEARWDWMSLTMVSLMLAFVCIVLPLCIRADFKSMDEKVERCKKTWSSTISRTEQLHVNEFGKIKGTDYDEPRFLVTYTESPARVDEVSCLIEPITTCELVKTRTH